jgi:hypothetical protein
MFDAARQDTSFAEYEDVSELTPIFLVMVDDERNLRVFEDVATSFEFLRRDTLRLLVHRRIKIFAVENEANGDHVRLADSVGRSEMRNASRADEVCDLSG